MSPNGDGLSPRGEVILFGVVSLMGAALLWLIVWAFWVGVAPFFWDKVDCRILSSTVTLPETPGTDPYVFEPRYSYRYQGQDFVGTAVAPGYSGDSDYAEVQELQRRYPEGALALCRVDSEDPSRAVLMPHFDWVMILLLFLPAIFLIPGPPLFLRAWRELRGGPRVGSELDFGRWSWLLKLGFSSLFLIGGVGYCYIGFLGPTRQALDAQGWTEGSCTVVTSGYRSYLGDSDAPTTEYAPDILYEYRFGGEEYRSNRYDFQGATSGDLPFIEGIVARYPEGAAVTCYVDPDRPEQAVLEPGMNGWLAVPALLFSLPFIAMGLWLLLALLSEWRAVRVLIPRWVPEAPGIVTGAVERVLRSLVTAVNKMRER